MTTNEQYLNNELKRFNKEVVDRDSMPLPDRKDGFNSILEAIKEKSFVDHIVRTVDNILSGDYGIGILVAYSKLSKRHNRKAWLGMQAGSIEYCTSTTYATMAYKMLSVEEQETLNNAIDELIAEFDINPTVTL